jgi:endonuclease YncB( thermonuclease family)
MINRRPNRHDRSVRRPKYTPVSESALIRVKRSHERFHPGGDAVYRPLPVDYLVAMKSWRDSILLALLAIGPVIAHADIDGKVVAVTDGDTIKLLDADNTLYKIRLTGIDAPEKGQPFGNASLKHLASLVAGKNVRVESSKRDRYGRVLGKVWVQPPDCPSCGNTLDANHAQILAGMAWWYQYYADEQPEQDRERYKSAASEAKRRGMGLWSEPEPIPPWAWRRGQRTPPGTETVQDFRCGSKRFCREMKSCEEARFYLQSCGTSSLDGDGDGVPCESICR